MADTDVSVTITKQKSLPSATCAFTKHIDFSLSYSNVDSNGNSIEYILSWHCILDDNHSCGDPNGAMGKTVNIIFNIIYHLNVASQPWYVETKKDLEIKEKIRTNITNLVSSTITRYILNDYDNNKIIRNSRTDSKNSKSYWILNLDEYISAY